MYLEPAHNTQEYAFSFQRGEEKGFAWFFRNLYPPLCLFAHKLTSNQPVSEEIASAAFLKIWQRHRQFSSPESIRAYLYQIVRNDALKWLKKGQQEATAFEEVSYLCTLEKQQDQFQQLVTAETIRQLYTTMEALPTECSKVFHMLYVEGKSVKETAEELHLSLSTVKTQKKRGLEFMRKQLASFLSTFCFIWESFYDILHFLL